MHTQELASLKIYNQKAYIPAVLSFIDSIVSSHKEYDVSRCNNQRYVVTEMLKRRINRAYPGERGEIYVELFIRDGFFEISIRDKGVPEWFDFNTRGMPEKMDQGEFYKYILRSFVDQVGVEKLGKDGQRMYVRQKIVNPLQFKAPDPYKEQEVLDKNITIRPVKTEKDVIEAIRCIYSEYGYSYSYEKLYYVDSFLRTIESGAIMSFLAVNEHGQTAGHFALSFSELFEGMPEISTVVIRKEFRGLGLFSAFIDHSIAIAKENGFRALMGQPVGFHPMSQKAFLRGGFTATSLLLSYVGADIESEYNPNKERLDLFSSVKILDPSAREEIYPPKELADFVKKIYTRAGCGYRLGTERATAENTQIRLEENCSQQMKRVILREAGMDCETILNEVVRDAIRKKDEMIELFLSLRTPSCEHGYEAAKKCGFVLSGLIPGARNDDYLILQILLQKERNYDQLVTVGEFEELTKEIARLTSKEKAEVHYEF